jgi:ATP-dependent metalloprotease
MTQFGLHAGQLRYHDFSKLRGVPQARLLSSDSASASNKRFLTTAIATGSPFSFSSLNSNNNIASLPQEQQRRTFFSLTNAVSSRLERLQLKGLETVANSRPNDAQAQYEFLSKLYATNNAQALVERMSHSMFRQYAVDARIAMLYLQALGQTQRYSNFSMDDLTQRLQEYDPQHANTIGIKEFVEESRKRTKAEQVSGLAQVLSGGGGMGMGMMGAAAGSNAAAALQGGGRGADPKVPVHVQLHNPTSTRSALIALTGRVLIAFVVVSALSALLDEKGVARGMGMNSGSKHIQQAQEMTDISFDDVKGVEEAKAELQEIVMYLKNPSKFTRLGGKLPRGLLLTGPPGTGKTLLAKAIAGEADVPFFFSSGSQFEEVYVGLGAKRIRELFEAAKKKSPCIIFIDEIDAVGGTRKLKDQSALKMTLNELLVQLDGFEDNSGIIVIGATNFMESLDTALLRPGRFDKHIVVPLPDVGGRKDILEMYGKKTKLHPSVDLNVLARGTTGFSGADLFNLMNQAALKASIDGLNNITMARVRQG